MRLLVVDAGPTGGDATYAPTKAQLAFVTRRGDYTALKIAAESGLPARTLTTVSGQISSPAWSPDGDTIACIVRPLHQSITAVYMVNVATGRIHLVVAANQLAMIAKGYFVRLAWL